MGTFWSLVWAFRALMEASLEVLWLAHAFLELISSYFWLSGVEKGKGASPLMQTFLGRL